MSRFRKVSHSIWHCQYHIVWVPKYKFRIITGRVSEEVNRCIRAFTEQQKSEVVELNIQNDYVHLLVMIPPKRAVVPFVISIPTSPANPSLETPPS